METVGTECVLVVPTSVFRALGHFQGFTTEVDRYLFELLEPRHITYRPRAKMEGDPSFKQLIPYVILRHIPPGRPATLFQYTRGGGQGEVRLRRKLSVGVGGHISTCDRHIDSAVSYELGMQRELEEEVSICTPYTQRVVGMINDDETDVGRVHLGVVHLFDVHEPRVEPRESEMLEAGFRPISELLGRLEAMESWSRICMEALFAQD
jgi:predicted NUDIX family phosphoesterase